MFLRVLLCASVACLASCNGAINGPGGGRGGAGGAGNGGVDPTDELLKQCGNPGHVTLRHLNRSEYNNTVRDLLGDNTQPANEWPADPSATFDNNGDVLAVSPYQFELYEGTADRIVEAALRPPPSPVTKQLEGEALTAAMCPGGKPPPGAIYNCFEFNTGTGGSPAFTYTAFQENNFQVDRDEPIAADGDYKVTLRVFKAAAGAPKLDVVVDGKSVFQVAVNAPITAPDLVSFNITLATGLHHFEFQNTDNSAAANNGFSRNLGLDYVRIEGPFLPPNPARDEFRAKFFSCNPAVDGQDPCARKILGDFARRAYRRPVTEADLTELLPFVSQAIAQGDDFNTGIRNAIKRVLLSPDFLFLPEIDANPESTDSHPVSPFEMASRLSYFLWASAPDAELLAAAESGALADKAEVVKQAQRLLADPKSDALVDTFGVQWLKLGKLTFQSPAVDTFPSFDGILKNAMRDETTLFFKSFLKEDKSVTEMLDAKYTFLNDRLAQHYGIGGITGSEMRRVDLTNPQRGGILTHGSFLTFTSQPNRTSPVKRGNWVLQQLLCQEPPPPPANVPPIPEGTQTAGKTIRELTEAHRANPACAACHAMMDPIGYSLEHYDGIGTWRDKDGTFAINATGKLPDGRTFDGAQQLAQTIKADPALTKCVAKKMLIYGIGRELTEGDLCTVDALATGWSATGARLKGLALEVVKTDQFRMRRGGKGAFTP